jgi:uncharacterized protein (UPF0276 family)
MSPDAQILGFGLGLRAPHYDTVLAQPVAVDWFEILSENYMEAHPGYWELLADIRARYPLVMHGVAMNIAGTDPMNTAYIAKLKALVAHVRPVFLSDHLCWTGTHGIHTHDLLPVPYTEEALQHVCARVDRVQQMLGLQLVLENPSTYLQFVASEMPEEVFLARLAERTGCGLLIDVNNVYVSAFNHGFDAKAYIDAIPAQAVAYIHLAGHTHHGTHIVDTHNAVVAAAVWELYRYTLQRNGMIPTMIEWDGDIPAFDVLLGELDRARAIAQPFLPALREAV